MTWQREKMGVGGSGSGGERRRVGRGTRETQGLKSKQEKQEKEAYKALLLHQNMVGDVVNHLRSKHPVSIAKRKSALRTSFPPRGHSKLPPFNVRSSKVRVRLLGVHVCEFAVEDKVVSLGPESRRDPATEERVREDGTVLQGKKPE